MPNIDVKAIKAVLRDLFIEVIAATVGWGNKHLADPEAADCQCRIHQQAKIDAALATPPVNSRGSRGTSTPSPSPKSRKAPSRAGDKKLPPV
jgi:hypothetical protein